jgi:WD40 repeat protein
MIALAAVSQASVSSAGASASGDRLWLTRGGTQLRPVSSVASVVSPDGSRVFQTGVQQARGHDTYATNAFDAVTGARLWVARSPDRRHAYSRPSAIAVSPDGSTVFVTGATNYPRQVTDYLTIAYDAATGSQRWIARFDDANHGLDSAWSMAVSPDGTLVYVTGSADYSSGHAFGATIAYDAATGQKVWQTNILGADGPNAAGLVVVASPDGSHVFVIGGRAGTTLIFAYDAATGSESWTDAYQSVLLSSEFFSAVVSRDGSSLYVSGSDERGCCKSFSVTIAYDAATGVRRWESRFPDHPGPNSNEVTSIAVSPDGAALFVTGYHVYLDRSFHYTTLAYDTSDGHLLWHRFYPEGQAFSIAVSPDGKHVVVTGQAFGVDSGSGATIDYATIAYDAATGAQVWRARYDDPAHGYDSARAVVIDPAGSRVFVTGYGPMIAYSL